MTEYRKLQRVIFPEKDEREWRDSLLSTLKNFETVYIVYINYLYPNFVDSFLFSYHQAINRLDMYTPPNAMTIINYHNDLKQI